MPENTTLAYDHPDVRRIRKTLDKYIEINPDSKTIPLYKKDYDFYLKQVIKIDMMHTGNIYYKDRILK